MQDVFFSQVQNFRYERKFMIDEWSYADLLNMVRLHPALFREIYHKRQVNNLYWDDLTHQNYYDNIDGISQRLKARIRWYGETFGRIDKPVLELKFKRNLHVGKLSYPLCPFVLAPPFNAKDLQAVFRESKLEQGLLMYLRNLRLSLLNSYQRQYFLTADRHFRLTLDQDLAFYPLQEGPNWFRHRQSRDEQVVAELKYNSMHDLEAAAVSAPFPFRLSRSSKYVQGMETVY